MILFSDAIERRLSHGERNQIQVAHNYAQCLPEPHRMMQEWADYLEQLMKHNVLTFKVA